MILLSGVGGRGIIFVHMTFIAPHYRKAKKKAFLPFFRKDHFLVKTPWWLKKLYPYCVWDMPSEEKVLYLSFDDGPHPTITPFVLEQLRKYNAKASFFCIGENVIRYPEIFARLTAEGHAVGNHTQHHINGWKNDDEMYINDISEAAIHIRSPLFRPPYGRIRRSQIRKLHQQKTAEGKSYSIIMWNILAGDWVEHLHPEKCYRRIEGKISNGDIIVFHDSEKAWDRMSYCLPLLLEKFTREGYRFEKIEA